MLVRRSDQFARVVTEKLMTYALGRGVEYQDMPLVRSIVHDSAGGNYKFSSMVMGIVKSPAFQMNMKQPRASGNGGQLAQSLRQEEDSHHVHYQKAHFPPDGSARRRRDARAAACSTR